MKIYRVFVLFLLLSLLISPFSTIVDGRPVKAADIEENQPQTEIQTTPVAYPQHLIVIQGTYTELLLTGFDADEDRLQFIVTEFPEHGNLQGTAPYLSYTSDADYVGDDSFIFVVSDGETQSEPALVSIEVRTNTDPVAYPQNLTVIQGVYTEILLEGYDADEDRLQFIVNDYPEHGLLQGTAPYLSYTSDADYDGDDSFTFTVFDGFGMSEVATVSIEVRTNTDPVAYPQSLTVIQGVYTEILLEGYDADEDRLQFIVNDYPEHGLLQGTAPYLSYTSDADYFGDDSFTFTVFDGFGMSEVATVSIEVRTNTDPVAYPQSLTVIQGVYTEILLEGYDADEDRLQFIVNDYPEHGLLQGTAPYLSYTSDADYFGDDSFTFTVFDGFGMSEVATVSIEVRTNTDPVAYPQSLTVIQGVYTEILLEGYDADEDRLQFIVNDYPEHGLLQGTAPYLSYTSDADYFGDDSFTFTVFDGFGMSEVATVSIEVRTNTDPVAYPQSLTVIQGVYTEILLEGYDADEDQLQFIVNDYPEHGLLQGTAPYLSYTSDADYDGDDSFTFTVFDGYGMSEVATVSITVISSGPTTVFFDDFESDLGWIRNPFGTDTATSGRWERANPQSTWYWGIKQQGTTVSGYNDLVTGPLSGWDPGRFDVDNGMTTIISPEINLPDSEDLTLSFSYYFAHAINSSSADFLRISIIGESTEMILEEYGARNNDNAYWVTFTGSLNDFAGQSIYILIEAADYGTGSLVEAAVDDVLIIAH